MCFSLSYYKILYVLSTEVVHVRKSDHAANTNFPLPPFHSSEAWEGKGQGQINSPSAWREADLHGEKALGEKLTCERTLSPSLLVVLSTIWNVLSEKQKLKIECNFQFSNFRLPPKKGKLSYAPDCNIVGEAKLPLSLILLIVDRIKVKICVMFQYST